MNPMNIKKEREGGFTLLELLIVISIIAILSVALVLVLNPAEALKKSRDAQRISDLSTMKTALGLYMTSTSTPHLGGISSDAACFASANSLPPSGTVNIFYSLPTSVATISQTNLDGATPPYAAASQRSSVTSSTVTDGTGWIPVAFDSLIGGSPISNLPLDPTNALAAGNTGTNMTNADYVYRYACALSPFTFEMDAALESTAYTTGADNKMTSDGGNNANFYEVGTNLRILGINNDF